MSAEDKINICNAAIELIQAINDNGDWYFANLITGAVHTCDIGRIEEVREAIIRTLN